MAIAFDNSKANHTTASSSFTDAYTCTGSNLILFVGAFVGNTSNSISGITYNGVSMTQIGSPVTNVVKSYLFYLVAPATGSNNIVVSTTGGTNTIFYSAASYTGAKQTSPIDNSNTASGASLSLTVNQNPSGCWIVGFSGSANGTGVSYIAGSGFTLRQSDSGGSTGGQSGLEDTNGLVSTGSKTVAVSLSAGSVHTLLAASLLPLSVTNTMTLSPTSYTLSFPAFILTKQKVMTIVTLAYTITWNSFVITYIAKKWSNLSKSVTSWVNPSKS